MTKAICRHIHADRPTSSRLGPIEPVRERRVVLQIDGPWTSTRSSRVLRARVSQGIDLRPEDAPAASDCSVTSARTIARDGQRIAMRAVLVRHQL